MRITTHSVGPGITRANVFILLILSQALVSFIQSLRNSSLCFKAYHSWLKVRYSTAARSLYLVGLRRDLASYNVPGRLMIRCLCCLAYRCLEGGHSCLYISRW